MMKQALAYFPLKDLPLLGLFIFLVIFTSAVFWVFRKGSDQFYDRLSRLPLEEPNAKGVHHE